MIMSSSSSAQTIFPAAAALAQSRPLLSCLAHLRQLTISSSNFCISASFMVYLLKNIPGAISFHRQKSILRSNAPQNPSALIGENIRSLIFPPFLALWVERPLAALVSARLHRWHRLSHRLYALRTSNSHERCRCVFYLGEHPKAGQGSWLLLLAQRFYGASLHH